MAKFLDESGLQHYHQKFSEELDGKKWIREEAADNKYLSAYNGHIQIPLYIRKDGKIGFYQVVTGRWGSDFVHSEAFIGVTSEFSPAPNRTDFPGTVNINVAGDQVVYTPCDVLVLNGQISVKGTLSMNANQIVNVKNPTDDYHATNKKYVDDAILAAIGSAIEEAY